MPWLRASAAIGDFESAVKWQIKSNALARSPLEQKEGEARLKQYLGKAAVNRDRRPGRRRAVADRPGRSHARDNHAAEPTRQRVRHAQLASDAMREHLRGRSGSGRPA